MVNLTQGGNSMNSSVPIAHYENRYKITTDGQVINLANNSYLTPILNSNGYYKVSLADGIAGLKQKFIHQLVTEHFLPNPYKYTQVNHVNGDKLDNRLVNLEWCTPLQNIQHALKTGLRPGYMSADDKERYMYLVMNGTRIVDLAKEIGRRQESLSAMLRKTAERLGFEILWKDKMKEHRRETAIRNLDKINHRDSY
jgi:hypothetical protein